MKPTLPKGTVTVRSFLFLPVMSVNPLMENFPFAPSVDVNKKQSGGDFLKEVCFCNHQCSAAAEM